MLTNDEALRALQVAVTALNLIAGDDDTFETFTAKTALRIMDEKFGISVETNCTTWGKT